MPGDENELIIPAREGTLQVLPCLARAAVRRVVITSSMARHRLRPSSRKAHPFDETNWTNLGWRVDVQPYVKSKTLAERAAWDFIAREGGGLELSVVNPAGVFGPALGPDFSGSIDIIRALLDGSHAGGAEDLFRPGRRARRRRSASARHDQSPAAKGERFIAVAGEPMSILEIARVLRRELGSAARRVPRFQAPDWVVRLAARRNPVACATP